MGAPKQKWTAEEEAALKAGVRKHGMGKWRTILTDPEFNSVLRLRSNVDLKDKWRNINVTAIWGSRQKAKLALKRDENSKALIVSQRNNDEDADAKPLGVAAGTSSNGGSKETLPRLEYMILEAITTLNESSGSEKASIALYIESNYSAMHNARKLLAGKLNLLVSTGKIVKVKHKYKIPSNDSEGKLNSLSSINEGKNKEASKVDKTSTKILTKSQVDQELSKLRGLSAIEAAAAAAKAVAEAEAAIAEAEQAAREAELAEAEAEAAQVFAKAAVKAFKYRLRSS